MLEFSEGTGKVCPPVCMQMILSVFFLSFSSFFFFFFIQEWEERAGSAAIDENQTPNV